MKRFVVALAVLLCSYGLSRADYVIIIYNLGTVAEVPGGGMAGMPGGMMGMPGGGMGGGPTLPPGGMAGMGGGPTLPPGGMRGGRGAGGGAMGYMGMGGGPTLPPGGMTGGPTLPPGGMGGTGMGGTGIGGVNGVNGGGPMMPPGGMGGWQPPTGFGGGPQMPPGAMGGGAMLGGRGGMPPGAMGGGGMLGGAGGIGGMFIGGAGAMGGTPDQNFTPLLAMAVVEVDKWSMPLGPNAGVLLTHHKYTGRTGSYVLLTTADKKLTAAPLRSPTLHARYLEQVKEAHPAGGKPDPLKLIALAEWTLKHGLLDEFAKIMTDELAKADPKNEAVVAFQQVQKAIDQDITKGDASDAWTRDVLAGYKVKKSPHYALLHNLDSADPPEVASRLKRLEDTYKSFFYWCALKGKAIPVPDHRLVAVLVKRGDEFKRQQQIFDSLPTVADGFLARRDNLAVFSLERTDAASAALKRNTKSLFDQLASDRDGSLKAWPRAIQKGVQIDLATGVEIQTLALLDRAMQEDAEISSVTHEGTRQLLAATGMLPRNVAVPEWLQFGWASFLETPKGALWMTIGSPNSSLLPEFNYLGNYKAAEKAGKLKDHTKALIDVVTDNDFRDYAKNPNSEEAKVKARTMAWSLTYFLANSTYLPGLQRYHEELKKLPRDLEFDGQTLLLAFARAFDCVSAANPNAVDQTKLGKIADAWNYYIRSAPSEDESLQQELAKKQAELKSQHAPKKGEPPPMP